MADLTPEHAELLAEAVKRPGVAAAQAAHGDIGGVKLLAALREVDQLHAEVEQLRDHNQQLEALLVQAEDYAREQGDIAGEADQVMIEAADVLAGERAERDRLAAVIEQVRALPAILLYRPILGTAPGATQEVVSRDAILALLPPTEEGTAT